MIKTQKKTELEYNFFKLIASTKKQINKYSTANILNSERLLLP